MRLCSSRQICRKLLVDALLKYPNSTAAVVDTTGHFDVLRLYTSILEQLKTLPDTLARCRTATSSKAENTVEEVAAEILDHVKIMRVFDFVGVREAIGEIRDGLEEKRPLSHKTNEAQEEPMEEGKISTPQPAPTSKRTVVADSEDEDDEEEMLFDTSVASVKAVSAIKVSESLSQPQAAVAETFEEQELLEEKMKGEVKFILIDNLAQVTNPLLKKDYIQGQSHPVLTHPRILIPAANAIALTFLQTLNHLTRTYKLHTILANPAILPRPTSPMRQSVGNSALPPPDQHKQPPPPPPSIFASNTLVPSLANVLARYVDVSLLVSQLPRRKMDAHVFYRDGNAAGVKKLRGVELVSVVEVVSDRWGGRVGAWGAFGGR